MDANSKFTDSLGQHMTPPKLADFVARQLPSKTALVVDLAAGDAALLAAAKKRFRTVRVVGVDCDQQRVDSARKVLRGSQVAQGDGLRFDVTIKHGSPQKGVGFVGNPPFLLVERKPLHAFLQREAFPGLESTQTHRRLEVSFLAKALLEARTCGGYVAMLMPSAFASGLQYAACRKALMNHYKLVKCVEITQCRFRDTEAKTILLVVDTSRRKTNTVRIESFSVETGILSRVHAGPVSPGDRLDARYWKAAHLRAIDAPTLGDIGVEITRGRRCNASARDSQQQLFHTTDLKRAKGKRIWLGNCWDATSKAYAGDTIVSKGDILLPRTGSRLIWEPIEVIRGRAPISDHLLRIRAPNELRSMIASSFHHPLFGDWLDSISKGVCATVITKKELLTMPLFSLNSHST